MRRASSVARPSVRTTALAATALLAACAAVGPNYERPLGVASDATGAPAFVRAGSAPSPGVATPAASGFVVSSPPPARWWESVGDRILTRLVDDAFAASPTLEAATARLRSALAQQSLDRAAFGPTGGASGRYVRSRIPTDAVQSSAGAGAAAGGQGTLPNPLDISTYSLTTNATWEIDLFGGTRRTLEAAVASAQARQAALEDLQVSLANDMAQAYAQLREAQGRRHLALATISMREQTLALTVQRRARGAAADGDVARADGDLARSRAEVPGLQNRIEQQLDQIALLAGRASGAYDALLEVPADRPVEPPLPPEAIPVGEPADWLRRRPDIRQAERTLAARNATIGVNVARLFPTVSLLGFLGVSAPHPGALFDGGLIRLITPSITWNFLDIPSNRARVRGAEADRDESLADYRRTVLAALQDANDSLSRFGRARETLVLREAARRSAERAAAIVRRRFEGGTASLIDALDAERQRAQADDEWTQARSGLMVAYASLQKSLGVGWGATPPTGQAAPPS